MAAPRWCLLVVLMLTCGGAPGAAEVDPLQVRPKDPSRLVASEIHCDNCAIHSILERLQLRAALASCATAVEPHFTAAPTASCPLPCLQAAYQEVPGSIIVKLRPDVVAAMDANSHGLRYKRPAGLPNAGVYDITDGQSTRSKCREMRKHPGVLLLGSVQGSAALLLPCFGCRLGWWTWQCLVPDCKRLGLNR